MADAISETVYINEEFKVYGLLYDYDGVTATAAQFYLTDSSNHFLGVLCISIQRLQIRFCQLTTFLKTI